MKDKEQLLKIKEKSLKELLAEPMESKWAMRHVIAGLKCDIKKMKEELKV